MRRAIRLARKGIGTTHPNPRVGAVVVKDGQLVGQGWHQRVGGPHAEVHALQQAGDKAQGATIYVTLEPCASAGRTPACTDAVLKAGISRLVYASSDPNPKMAGGGSLLEQAGIETVAGVMQAQADLLNIPFFHYVRTGRPYVIGKAAISLDGKLATRTGHSQWISGSVSRRHAHELRAASDAILVGSGTLLADNPALTVRDARNKGDLPLRVAICGDTPPFFPDCKFLSGEAPSRLYVKNFNEHTIAWSNTGVEVVLADSLVAVLRHLAEDGMLQLLLEGGGGLHAAFLEAGLTDELVLYQAPMLIGGRHAVSLWAGEGVETVQDAIRLTDITRKRLGNDQMIRGRVIYPG